MLLTPSSTCWPVSAPADVIVAVVVPSDTVKVLVAVTAKELVPVRPETPPVARAVVPVLASALRAVDWALATRLVRDGKTTRGQICNLYEI